MKDIIIHEAGMRDGLQMEKAVVPTDTKIQWIDKLIESGIKIIQAGSFVHPVKVPQMADTDDLFRHFSGKGKPGDVILSGLVLNEKGLERALDCGVDMVCMGVSASETHSKKNTGMTVDDALERITAMALDAQKRGKKVQVSVQSAFGCGFEGPIDEKRVYAIVEKYIDNGLTNISLADTAGHANPAQVERMFENISSLSGNITMACHFHNTYGLGLANCLAAMKSGVKYYETAFGGLGGCPFTKVAAGNVCTEDFVNMLQKMEIDTDIDLNSLSEISKMVSEYFDKSLPGYYYKLHKG